MQLIIENIPFSKICIELHRGKHTDANTDQILFACLSIMDSTQPYACCSNIGLSGLNIYIINFIRLIPLKLSVDGNLKKKKDQYDQICVCTCTHYTHKQ